MLCYACEIHDHGLHITHMSMARDTKRRLEVFLNNGVLSTYIRLSLNHAEEPAIQKKYWSVYLISYESHFTEFIN
jgi:hypothetical protein